MSCGDSFVRFLLLLLNALFAICGIVLVALGVILKVLFDNYLNFEDNAVWSPSLFLIILGAIIFLVASFGCFGASQKNVCLISTFAFFLGFIFLMEVGVAITAVVLKKDMRNAIENNLKDAMEKYNVTYFGYQGTTVWDTVQKKFHCCGVNNYTDWAHTTFGEGVNVPDSCCIKVEKGCGVDALEDLIKSKNINHKGCWKKLEKAVSDKVVIIAAVTGAVLLIQLLEIMMAVSLARAIQKGYRPLLDE